MVNIIYQAEDANYLGPVFYPGQGADGTGYLDYTNALNDFIEWSINAPAAGIYNLGFRYALDGNNRPLRLSINGLLEISSKDFPNTGDFSNWQFVNQAVELNAGVNKVRLTAIGSSGANFDYLLLTNTQRKVTISDATAAEGFDDFLVFDVFLSAPSTSAITLNLAASDGTARGGLIANFPLDLSGNPVDYANQQFEVSTNNGTTWQPAANGTKVTFAPGQTYLQVRLAANNDLANEGSIPQTMNLGVAQVLSGAVDDSTDTGTGAIIDDDGDIANNIYQAERANYSGPILSRGQGAEGAGYLDFQNSTGDFIEWTVTVPKSGSYNLGWRYALEDINRPLQLLINGIEETASLNFPDTGSFSIWNVLNKPVELNAGVNKIKLTAIGSSGPNFDYLQVSELGRKVTISQALAAEGFDPFIVFDVGLSAPSLQPITLNLAAINGTGIGGLISNFNSDLTGNPIDFANREFEVSTNNGTTWAPAVNGTQVSFAPGQTSLQVRLAVNNDLKNEGAVPETMTLKVANVVSGSVDNFSDQGVGLISDDDSDSADKIYQAEQAAYVGPVFVKGQGAQGTGYLDFQNPTGDFIEWTVDVPSAGVYNLSWRYALSGANRPLRLTIDGVVQAQNVDFADTGGFTSWDFTSQNLELNAGVQKIRLTAIGSNGANFDYFKLTKVERKVIIGNAIATEGTDDFLVFDVSISAASKQAITLDLATIDGTANGGLISQFNVDPAGNPIDYAKQQFEVSTDGGNTWGPAVNGTRVSFAPGKTSLKVRLAVNDDTAIEGNLPETMKLGVAEVISGNVTDISAQGNGLISDNDFNLQNGIYEAENASFTGPAFFTGRGAQGLGYLDYQNSKDDFIDWKINVPAAGRYNLSWRYALGDVNRPLQLKVNGQEKIASLDFTDTGDFSNWDFATTPVELNAGVNNIRLTAIGKSGANFDYLSVTKLPRKVEISDAIATEGADNFLGLNLVNFLVFNVTLNAPSNEAITLNLVATNKKAKGGLISAFNLDPAGDPVDYANKEFDFSTDNGITWKPATNGTQITFAPGETSILVRLAINDDLADEGPVPEAMSLGVGQVVSGTVDDISKTGTGLIYDNDSTKSSAVPISLLPYTDIRVEGNKVFNFDGTDDGLIDTNGDRLGFTMVDPAPKPGNPTPTKGIVGYWPSKIDLNPTQGILKLTTTPGLQYLNSNSLDNALGIGLNVPSKKVTIQSKLVNLPAAPGGSAQAGLWFGSGNLGGLGSSQDNYIKFVVVSPNPGNYILQALMEQSGTPVAEQNIDIPNNLTSLNLSLSVDPISRTVAANYNLNNGGEQNLFTFGKTNVIPEEWFSFDQAAIDPRIGTRSFGGIFASNRNASTPQVFSFDKFSVTEGTVAPILADFPFDRWSIPVSYATAMAMGPDGRLYVATLFGQIHALTINPVTRTYTDQVINTIPQSEGGSRLTLGLAIDPASTPNNVNLWVAHSDGQIFNSVNGYNSGKISRLSGPNFATKEDIITGLPRSISNHATNNIEFGPDGRLYMWQGGNTGAGSANNEPSEFGDLAEQVLSAALLVADVKKPNFNGNAASLPGEFVDQFYARTNSDVKIYATGLRNTYSGVFHSNGKIYAGNNSLGVVGTVPPVPRLGSATDRTKTTLFGQNPQDNPGTQPDDLNLIVEGGYYGHPNPYRDEVIFKDGIFQGFNANNRPPNHPVYKQALYNLGEHRSPNGIIEYTGNNFFGKLKGDLLITNFSEGDNISRLQLSSNGLTVTNSSTLIDGFTDPLPILMGSNGQMFVGEFNGDKITILEPMGNWRSDLPSAPIALLEPGSATVGGQLYIIGGKAGNNNVSTTYIYTPNDPLKATDDVWNTAPSLPGPAVEAPSVVAFNQKVYAFGGLSDLASAPVNNSAVFNPSNSSWNTLAPMLTPRGEATVQVVSNKIYVIGGVGANGASLNSVEVYDPLTNTWSQGPSMSTPRNNLGSAVINNKLYVFGGETRSVGGSLSNANLNSMEIFDPVTGVWSAGKPMPTGRSSVNVGTINGRIQVIGGKTGTVGTVVNQNEEYNPLTQTWRALPQIDTPRAGAAFGTIDNFIYVSGGSSLNGLTPVTEAFSP